MPSWFDLLKWPSKGREKEPRQGATKDPAWQRRWDEPVSEPRVPETTLHRCYRLGEIGVDQYLRDREPFRKVARVGNEHSMDTT